MYTTANPGKQKLYFYFQNNLKQTLNLRRLLLGIKTGNVSCMQVPNTLSCTPPMIALTQDGSARVQRSGGGGGKKAAVLHSCLRGEEGIAPIAPNKHPGFGHQLLDGPVVPTGPRRPLGVRGCDTAGGGWSARAAQNIRSKKTQILKSRPVLCPWEEMMLAIVKSTRLIRILTSRLTVLQTRDSAPSHSGHLSIQIFVANSNRDWFSALKTGTEERPLSELRALAQSTAVIDSGLQGLPGRMEGCVYVGGPPTTSF